MTYRLGSACSHVAALLFKLQMCSQMDMNKIASTSKLCAWNRSRKHVESAPLKIIDFRRPKKGSLPREITPEQPSVISISGADPHFETHLKM